MANYASSTGINDLIIKLENETAMNYRPPRYYGMDERIYVAEIHLLVSICECPFYNVSQLAEYLGVTKSMVSKTAGQLERKGFVKRMRAVNNSKEVFFAPTEKGNKAYEGHNSFHRCWDHNKWTGYEQMPERDKELITQFLINYIQYMHEMGENLRQEARIRAGQAAE